MATSPIVQIDLCQTLLEATEEVNQISCSCRGDLWVSAADDSGTVHVVHPESKRRRVLRHDSNNVAMAMSAVFRPKRRDEIASGGTDCTVHLWDVSKPRWVGVRSGV
jgi:WD40 repeat protein